MIDDLLPKEVRLFIREQEDHWGERTVISAKYSLYYLHRWMKRKALTYPDLTCELVQDFLRCPNGKIQTLPSQKATLTRVYAYLAWRNKCQPLSFDPQQLFPVRKAPLRQYAPESVFQFCEARRAYWSEASLRMAYYTAASLHRWMHWNQLSWQDLTPERIGSFFEKPCWQKVGQGSGALLRRYTRHYILWLHENGLITTDPRGFLPQPLHIYFRIPCDPVSAATVERFIQDRQAKGFRDRPAKYRYILKRFHSWLGRAGIPLASVGDGTLDEFLIFSKDQGSSHRYRSFSRKYLRNYLGWLHEVGEITLQQPDLLPVQSRPHHHLPEHLPKYGEEFLEFLSINLKPNSVSNYQDSVRHFHAFMKRNRLAPARLKRRHCESFMSSLKERGLSANWRKKIIVAVRIYLHWLHERKIVPTNPDHLLRAADFPKLPLYLPRPLPPDIDGELQRRLGQSDDILAWSMLLMRHTGIRIGELRSLEADCLRTDHMGRKFMKVPLGKLDSERMVPLAPASAELIGRIKRRSAEHLQRSGIKKLPERLVYGVTGKNPQLDEFRVALADACHGLRDKDPITAHRLRHTFATSLLNAGMSLSAIMRLLGHRSTKMTLRYAAVSPETVRQEFEAAMTRMEERHQIQEKLRPQLRESSTVDGCFNDLLHAVKARADADAARPARRLGLMVKRLHRLKRELDDFFQNAEPAALG